MLETFDQLSDRVEKLAGYVDAQRAENKSLRAKIKEQVAEAMEIREACQRLQARVAELEGEANTKNELDSQIRERLRGILGKIDTIEQQSAVPAEQ